MDIRIIREPIPRKALEELMRAHYRTFIKGVADIERGIIALGGDWHMDANTALVTDGSEQKNLWGFNVYPNKKEDEALEYESLINIRPGQNNRSRELQDQQLRSRVRALVARLIPELGL